MGNKKQVKAKTTKKAELINTETLENSIQEVTAKAADTPTKEKTKAKKETKVKSVRVSVYTDQVMAGLTSLQKKAKRRELRHTLASYVSKYDKALKNKDDKAIQELKKDWTSYAKETYRDINKLFESNTKEENQEAYNRFLKAMTK
jgi:hypothetical protein